MTFELESIDRLFLNGYVSALQTPKALAHFLRKYRGAKFAWSILLDEISRDFTRRIERFVEEQGIEVHRFAKGERKERGDSAVRKLAATWRDEPPGAPDLAACARSCGLSYSHWRALFVEENGVSPYHFLLARRVELAGAALLAGVSIKEAGFSAGFTHVETFHRAFRRVTGLSPAEYRRQVGTG